MRVRNAPGFTVLELLIVVAIIAVLAAIAIPGYLRARMASNEASALSSLRVINLAQIRYSSSCGNDGFATTFAALSARQPGATEPFVPAEFTAPEPIKAGYVFTLGAGAGSFAGDLDCHGTVTRSSYYAAATPESFGITGSRAFATTQADTIWALSSAIAPAEPFGSPAVAVG